ncbi:secreted protein [Melampsora americana]|nr:secreted protein [Melampsora americana]KAH9823339.1 secreted protein [Melampsora americana]
MQFGSKLFTILALVALVGSVVGQPVDTEQVAGDSILEKRWDNWRWGHNIRHHGGDRWNIDGSDIWRIRGAIAARRNGRWYGLNQSWFPGGRFPQNIREWHD